MYSVFQSVITIMMIILTMWQTYFVALPKEQAMFLPVKEFLCILCLK